jgi:tetratricopeptide (TPR) repeat protein
MTPHFARARWQRVVLGTGVAALVVWAVWWYTTPSPEPDAEPTLPTPPLSATPFLNAKPEVQYVGTAACAACHRGSHQSYLLTAHSHAFADVDPGAEPPDASFEHKLSGRSYRVYRKDGQLRHEEIQRSEEGKEVFRMDLPIRYRVGSGHFSRTYLVEIDGFLHESPLTWYVSKGQWGMSPGFDAAEHSSFERPAPAGCLACHVGRVDPAGTVHRPVLLEKAIGCESCHGPGALHVALHQPGQAAAAAEDWTIVNPGKLTRPRLEAICSLCHLNAAAKVYVRGRHLNDYRPGMPLTDYRIDYRFTSANDRMTVVGHVEQLRHSACYQKSEMTCLSCHDPHARARPADVTPHYRQHCLSCHKPQACRLAEAQRLRQDPSDNCVACHMPRGATDIPHVAFTHHRIGVHTAQTPAADKGLYDLVPTDDDSHLLPLDRQRNLGLAYFDVARNDEYAPYRELFVQRARTSLETVVAGGLRDAETIGALAVLCMPTDPPRSQALARNVLEAKDAAADVRAEALMLLAASDMKERRFQTAIGYLKDLVSLRRSSEDWGLLGICYLMDQQPAEALKALQHALSIRAGSYPVHAKLADAYRQLADWPRAREQEEKALWLAKRRRQ